MRAVVTGGAGFLGSHLSEFLMGQGYEVVVIDNLITGRMENLSCLMGSSGFQFIKHDVAKPIQVEGEVDWVIHFASPASPMDYTRFPIQTLKVGALGTHNTLGLAKAKGSSYLLASSSQVYGDPLVHPQGEDYWGNVNPIGVRGVYDEAKRFAEAMTMAYHRYHRMDTRISRIFNTYGPRMRTDDGRAIPTFIGQALKGEPLTAFGDGSQTRSFCYVSDLVEGVFRLMGSGYPEPLNLGNPAEMSVNDLAKLILELTGSRSRIEFKPLPADDPKVRRPDIAKARELLGWWPKVELRQGLDQTIAWFQQLLGGSATIVGQADF